MSFFIIIFVLILAKRPLKTFAVFGILWEISGNEKKENSQRTCPPVTTIYIYDMQKKLNVHVCKFVQRRVYYYDNCLYLIYHKLHGVRTKRHAIHQ